MPNGDDKAVMTTEMPAGYPEPVLSQGPIDPSDSHLARQALAWPKSSSIRSDGKTQANFWANAVLLSRLREVRELPAGPGPGSWLSPSWFEAPILVRGGHPLWSHAPAPAGPPGITRKLALPGCRSSPCGAPSMGLGGPSSSSLAPRLDPLTPSCGPGVLESEGVTATRTWLWTPPQKGSDALPYTIPLLQTASLAREVWRPAGPGFTVGHLWAVWPHPPGWAHNQSPAVRVSWPRSSEKC